jgi:glycosyltransferase involved in cell wall biosynthesis
VITIGINAHLLSGEPGYRRAGIHHYIAELLNHLPASEEWRYVVYTQHPPAIDRPDMRFVPSTLPTSRRLVRILWEQLVWPMRALREKHSLLHSMAFVLPLAAPAPTVVTIYDLSFLHFPEQFPRLQHLYLTSQTRRSCRQARRVVTISGSSREDVIRFFGVAPDRVDVVPPGVDEQFRPLDADVVASFRREQGLPERFILHVGTLQPRKNLPVLVEAMARLGRPHLPLVLVGGKGWFYKQIFARVEALGLQDQVRFAGYVADETLPLWYNAASLLVFPSVYEGFGMPVVQAQACGTPVVAAGVSALPEAGGSAALYFEPDDMAGLVRQMLAVLDNPAQAATMREQGLIHASTFSWAAAGEGMSSVYRRALLPRSGSRDTVGHAQPE